MARRGAMIAAILAIAFALMIALLLHQQHGGPSHADFDLPGYEPATL